MPGVLLLGSPRTTWRDWLRHNRQGRDLLIADPADASLGASGRLGLWREDKLVAWRFYGSLSVLRSPHVALAAIMELLRSAGPEPLIQLFPHRPGPLSRQLALLIAEVVQPTQIFISSDAEIDLADWPVGPEEVELEDGFPPVVEAAQRRAQWLKLLQDCSEHEVGIRNLTIEGARLGSGITVNDSELRKLGLKEALHAEVCGSTLFLVSTQDIGEDKLASALDATHTSKAQIVSPDRYHNLLCSFARTGGEDFGMGVIQDADFEKGVFRILSTAVAPTPVQVLRIGGLRLTRDGKEDGEIRPWEV